MRGAPGGAQRPDEEIAEAGSFLADSSEAADQVGRLPDETGKALKESGVVRLLQPADFGGYEADPRDFLDAVIDVGSWCPSAGWVAGVVGVVPGENAGPIAMLHVMLPRADYEIVHDSWDVVGLEGTGSKDIVVQDAFVPGVVLSFLSREAG